MQELKDCDGLIETTQPICNYAKRKKKTCVFPIPVFQTHNPTNPNSHSLHQTRWPIHPKEPI